MLISTLIRALLISRASLATQNHARRIPGEFSTYHDKARWHSLQQGDVSLHREVEDTGPVTRKAYLGGLHDGDTRAA